MLEDIAFMYQNRGVMQVWLILIVFHYRNSTDQCFKIMKLGKYDQKIEFITEGNTSDGAGGYVPLQWRWESPTQRNIRTNAFSFYVGRTRKGFTITSHSVRWKIYQIIEPQRLDVQL